MPPYPSKPEGQTLPSSPATVLSPITYPNSHLLTSQTHRAHSYHRTLCCTLCSEPTVLRAPPSSGRTRHPHSWCTYQGLLSGLGGSKCVVAVLSLVCWDDGCDHCAWLIPKASYYLQPASLLPSSGHTVGAQEIPSDQVKTMNEHRLPQNSFA